jgi:hypothetical protein
LDIAYKNLIQRFEEHKKQSNILLNELTDEKNEEIYTLKFELAQLKQNIDEKVSKQKYFFFSSNFKN